MTESPEPSSPHVSGEIAVGAAAGKVIRRDHLAPKVVFVDGIEGCGKTMLAPIVSALDRAELLTYAYEIEQVCSLRFLDKLSDDAAVAMVSLLADLQLYNSMQSREINFRPGDLSSVFRASHPLKYFRRLFQPGDAQAAERIKAENPILCLTTHRMVAHCEPIVRALGRRVVMVEVVRHPLYVIIQNARNYGGLVDSARDFTIYYEYDDKSLPYFVRGWEDTYLSANAVERAIYSIRHVTDRSMKSSTFVRDRSESEILTIPFEKFVLDPDPYMGKLETALDTTVTSRTRRMMAKQKVPREKYADSIDLAIYRRCGWEPPKAGLSEHQELEYRRIWAASQASPEAMQVLDSLCEEYEIAYMGGALRKSGGSYI